MKKAFAMLVLATLLVACNTNKACFSVRPETSWTEWCFDTMPSCKRAAANYMSVHDHTITACDWKSQ